MQKALPTTSSTNALHDERHAQCRTERPRGSEVEDGRGGPCGPNTFTSLQLQEIHCAALGYAGPVGVAHQTGAEPALVGAETESSPGGERA